MSEQLLNEESQPVRNWYVLRDLKRANTLTPAYKQLTELGFQVFTPMKSKVVEKSGKQKRVEVPIIQDLLFVFSDRTALDKVIDQTPTLQYRYIKGAAYGTVMTVSPIDMHRFMIVVNSVKTPKYYAPEEITPQMYGARVRLVTEGVLNGCEGHLLKVRGSSKKRFLVELPGLLAATIEVPSTAYLELL